MAGKITIPITRDTGYELEDRIELEIDGSVQPDLIQMWPDATTRDGAVAGATVGPLMHETLASFSAGDYSVRVRGVDGKGNAGAWSAATVIEHRPTPATPTNLELDEGDLTGDWSDE